MRVLVFGDSIAQGFWGIEGGWVERLRKHYDRLALADLNDNNQPEIFNLGVDGDTTRNLLVRAEFETKVRKWPGDSTTAVIAMGTNDDQFRDDRQLVPPDEFKANIEKVAEILKPHVQKMMFVGNVACDEKLTTPVAWANIHYTNEQMEKYEQIIKEVASLREIAFVPIFGEFKKHLDSGDELLADGLHPNNAGHELIFNLVRPELDKLLSK